MQDEHFANQFANQAVSSFYNDEESVCEEAIFLD